MTPRHLVCFVFLAICFSTICYADTTPPTTLDIPAAARPTPNFDVKAATDAWLATVPPDKKARSDSYFEGGYWLQLWDFLLFSAIMFFMLRTRLSAHIRDWGARTVGNKNLQTLLYVLPFILITFLLQFPMSVYEGYVREHQYGLSTQTFGSWLRDQLVGLAISLVLGAIAIMILFAIVRRLGKNWWVWEHSPAWCC
jgi:STE24 endopeptidase